MGSDSTALLVHGGPEDGAGIPILKSRVTMGALPDNDITVFGPGVAGRHAEIFGRNNRHFLRDLGVVHRTYVNQRAIGNMEYMLQHGDRIQLAFSTVSHLFSSGNRPLDHSMPSIPVEEIRSIESLSANSQESEELVKTGPPLTQYEEPELYEGNVRLTVDVEGQIRLVISFVTELRLNSHLRMLRMEVNSPEIVDIWLALREPVPLRQVLGRMEIVDQVSGPPRRVTKQPDQVDNLNVRLNAEFGVSSLRPRFDKTISP